MSDSDGFLSITKVLIEKEMKNSYLDYAMSVIVNRAIPDAKDGLKPVHRRILYAMYEAGYYFNKSHVKSAKAIAATQGNYHPHGDQPIYDAIVRMAQDFSYRYMLIDGHGNFGSIDGDPAAAFRYTEVRLAKIAHSLLQNIEEDSVDFKLNYDSTTQEPDLLPAAFPNLLINGVSGIAVGVATSVPPHNLSEVIDACCEYVRNPHISDERLFEIVPAPDFPTGALILGKKGSRDAYRTGRGAITVRSKTHIEEIGKGREAIIVTEIPYQVNKARLIEKIAGYVNDKIITGISDLRDESDRDGIRIVIELKRDAISQVVLKQLFHHTQIQTNFNANMLALDFGVPKVMNLKQLIKAFCEFRENVILRRTRFRLRKAQERSHILLGLIVAVSNIDLIIKMIRSSKDPKEAKNEIMQKKWSIDSIIPYIKLIEVGFPEDQNFYYLSTSQTQAILDLKLQRLTALERDKITNDLQDLVEDIKFYMEILNSRSKLHGIMIEELELVKETFGDKRRSKIIEDDSDTSLEDLIQKEEMVVTFSHKGYIKRVPLSSYRAQNRGGKGKSGMKTYDEDFVNQIFVINTHTDVLFFSSYGKVYKLRVLDLPLLSPQSIGKAIINLLPLHKEERISTILPVSDECKKDIDKYDLMFSTASGSVRRNSLASFMNIPKPGKIAMKLNKDELVKVCLCNESQDVLLTTSRGKCIRFSVSDVRRFTSRNSSGVRGIRLIEGDKVISMSILEHLHLSLEEREDFLKSSLALRRKVIKGKTLTTEEKEFIDKEEFIMSISSLGFGKRTSSFEYRNTKRGGSGIANMNLPKNSKVVGSFPVLESEQIMLVTDKGQLIRSHIHQIRIIGRTTKGVKVFNVDSDEKVVSVSLISDGQVNQEN